MPFFSTEMSVLDEHVGGFDKPSQSYHQLLISVAKQSKVRYVDFDKNIDNSLVSVFYREGVLDRVLGLESRRASYSMVRIHFWVSLYKISPLPIPSRNR